uniref:TGF_BETA_2 domain-containing protein n=1 Tax=Heterorhabditis bacteriophora TaxID=37862 RepID=A0A1I7WNS5_HETBA
MMFLTLDMQLSSMIRHRRHLNPICNSQITHEGCCLYDLFVDFKSFGWEFIVAPLRYNAYICKGDCAMNTEMHNRIAHTRIAQTGGVGSASEKEHLMQCCHPAEYEAVKIVYVNQQNQLTVTKVDGMVARQCTCS